MKYPLPRVALCAALLSLSATTVSAQSELDLAVMEKLNLSDFTTQDLIIPELTDDGMVVEVEIDGQLLTMIMERHSMRSPDFKLLVSNGTGGPVEVEAPLPSTVRGEILELDGSRVIGGLIKGQLNAQIFYQGQEWAIQPLTSAVPSALTNQYVVYNAGNVTAHDGVCGVDGSRYLAGSTGGTANLGSGQRVCEIAIECDPSYYSGNGSSIQNTINDTEVILNRMDDIYDSDVDTRFILTTVHIWTANSPYSGDLGTRLDQFRSYWNGNFSFIKKDIAHYMVGGNSGGVIGVAWVGAVCTSYRYGVSRTKFSSNLTQRTALTAHEVGHNYSSGHCSGGSCTIMCASLGGCAGPLTHFGATSANIIRNYSFGRACTPENGPHLTAPWSDDFESNSINMDTWPARQGAATSTAATGETSGTRSLNLDGGNGTSEGQERIVSNYTLLQGQSNLFVNYNTEHVGVSNAGSLLVEYRQTSGAWEELNTVASNGSNQSVFEFHSHALPNNAYHNEFQLRFISEGGSGTGADWYIDDVSVGADGGGGGCPAPTNYCLSLPNSVGTGMLLAPSGTSSYAANDLSFLALGGPAGNFGVFFMGTNQTQTLFGDGILCTSQGILRYPVVQIDPFTTASLVVDYGVSPAAVNMVPGSAWNFQFWYRDPAAGGAGFNTTDAVHVDVCD